MASVSGVSSSSLYGTRNVLTGLASGMDTETLIENAISAYKNKITALQQKRTKTEWKQDAYRSIIDKMSVFSDKYTSYNSSTNLMSTSFFDQAVRTASKGENASKVTASGRTSSNVEINRVLQLAKASTYRVGGSQIGNKANNVASDGFATAVSADPFVLQDKMNISAISGSMTLAYGGEDARTYLNLSFDDSQIFANASELADEINKQLAEQTVSFSSGNSKSASELLEAKADSFGRIYFEDKANNGVYISSASENIQESILLGQKPGEGVSTLYASPETLQKQVDTYEYLGESPLKITLDGVTKEIDMPTKEQVEKYVSENFVKAKDGETADADGYKLNYDGTRINVSKEEAYTKLLQENIDKKFGKTASGKSKLEIGLVDATDENGQVMTDKDGNVLQKMQFKAGQEASTFTINSEKAWAMGFGEEETLTSYLNTNSTLKDLVNLNEASIESMAVKKLDADGNEIWAEDENGNAVYAKDKDGNFLLNEEGQRIRLHEYETDSDGKTLLSMKVNGVEVGQYTEDTALGTIISNINSNTKAGVSASYSKTTNELTFTAKNTGESEGVSMDSELAKALFGSGDGSDRGTFTKGQDAIFEVSINGASPMEVTRGSNSVEFDGLTVNLKGTFGYENVERDADGKITYDKVDTEAVSFETNSDADKIVDAVKAMVDDYNAMVTEIKNAYSTLPQQRSNGVYYEPLTDDDKEGMSESAIEAWENNAKMGILFGDSDLSQLYSRLTKAVSMYGENGDALKAAGITTSYSNGLTTLSFNEQTLRATLESDPDKVRDIFTKDGGLMQAVKTPLDQYGKTTGGKGILVDKAGSVLAPSTLYNNRIYKELTGIDEEIEKWQDKMSDRVDYYTTQFSKLEQLVSQMNSQSSYFSQLSGGY